MQFFCDESGGTDPDNTLFLVAAVRIDGVAAGRLVRSFRKVSGFVGELKGHRLVLPELRLFLDLLGKTTGVAAAVVCDRREPVGGWAMGALPEVQVYEQLLVGACCALPPLGGPATVAVDGGRYKRAAYTDLIARVADPVAAHHQGRASMDFADSERLPGIQVADVIANTVFHVLNGGSDAEATAALLRPLTEAGKLSIVSAEFKAVRPGWLR